MVRQAHHERCSDHLIPLVLSLSKGERRVKRGQGLAIRQRTDAPAEGGAHPLEFLFHPRAVAVAGASPPQPGFAGVAAGFVLALKEASASGGPAVYPVNPNHEEIEGLKCYPSLLDIDGPVDHVISSVPARAVPSLIDDCIAKGVKSIHFFTAGFSETGDEELAELEAQVVGRAVKAGLRVLGPNCMGLYSPAAGLSFMPGFPAEPGPVAFISQSGGNAADMVFTSAVRGIRYSKVVSYGNAADVDESELLDYLAQDAQSEIICAYIEGVKDGRRFLQAMRRAAAAKPVIVLKGGRTEAGTRAVHSHTGALAGSMEVFGALLRQVGAVRADSVEEMVDLAVAFRWASDLSGPGVAVVGGGGGFSVFAADELAEAGLACPVLPEATQRALREFTPVAGTSVRNPVDTIVIFDPALLRDTVTIVGDAENVDAVMFHTSFSFGGWRRSASWFDPQAYREKSLEALVEARRASGKPVIVVLRPPLSVESMEQSTAFQELCWRAGIPAFPSIPRAAGALAKLLRWREAREA
jgi:acyl-CoA synthetase (NDP forming)